MNYLDEMLEEAETLDSRMRNTRKDSQLDLDTRLESENYLDERLD